MQRTRLAALAAILLLSPCCNDSEPPTAPPGDGDPGLLPQSLTLGAPAQLVLQVPSQNPLIFQRGRYLHAASALEQLPGQRVSRALHRVVFSPATPQGATPSPSEAAYALFGFDLTFYSGDSSLVLHWQGRPPETERSFVGLANFEFDRWDWIDPPAAGPVRLRDLGPHTSDGRRLLLAVVVWGDEPAILEGVQLGERWLVGGVDLSLLCAPVMSFEAESLEADWRNRNPVPSEFERIGELTDLDGTRRIAISHRIEGLRHYGAVVIPPVEDFEKLPVLVVCHPGVTGTTLNGESWFFSQLGDPSFRQRFLIVIPSFRGEPLHASSFGVLTSEGPQSVFDRDADDTIALLDCVLENFENADPRLILATGYSRGAQVAMRVAQRDSRIRGVVEFSGMSDEWTPNGQGYMSDYLAAPQAEPDAADAYYHTLWELQQGLCDVWKARAVFMRSSIVYHAARLPKLQIHHGVLDTACPIGEADRLASVLRETLGADYECFRYESGDHSIQTLVGAGDRMAVFLRSFLE